jgi:hypothetical protein
MHKYRYIMGLVNRSFANIKADRNRLSRLLEHTRSFDTLLPWWQYLYSVCLFIEMDEGFGM